MTDREIADAALTVAAAALAFALLAFLKGWGIL